MFCLLEKRNHCFARTASVYRMHPCVPLTTGIVVTAVHTVMVNIGCTARPLDAVCTDAFDLRVFIIFCASGMVRGLRNTSRPRVTPPLGAPRMRQTCFKHASNNGPLKARGTNAVAHWY